MQKMIYMFLLACMFLGCQSSDPSSGSSKSSLVRLNIKEEPQTLDPRKARQLNSLSLTHLLFDGLMRGGKEGEVELSVADRVDISPDLKTYTFHLKKTLWSNADPVTAADFAYAWKKVLSPDFASDMASFLYVIKSAKLAKEGKISVDEVGIRVLDELTLAVDLEEPIPYFLELVAQPIFSPIPHKVDTQNPLWAQNADSYVSNGPFSLKKWNHQHQILLQKNPSYWDASCVRIESLQFEMLAEETELRLFEKGELDWAGSPVSELPIESLSSLEQEGLLQTQTGLGTAFLRINTQEPGLASIKMRRALALAIDREAIVKHVLQGRQEPAMRLLPPCFSKRQEELFHDADREQACALFNQALAESSQSKEALSQLTYLYRSSERNHLIAQAIQQQWFDAFGIRVKLEAVEAKVFFNRISKQDYQIAYGNWIGDFKDPINFLEVFKYKKGRSNNTHWESPAYISLLDRSALVPPGAQRDQLLMEAENILIADMPIIPLYYMNMLYVSQPYLKDVVLLSSGQMDFKWASMEVR